MSTQPESRLQRRIKKALLKAVGGWWVKIHGGPFQQAGIPDLIGCVEGLFFALEVKTPTGDTSEIQRFTLKAIRKEGGAIAKVVITPEAAVECVEDALRKAGRLSAARRRLVDGKAKRGPVLRTRDRKDVDHGRRRRRNVA